MIRPLPLAGLLIACAAAPAAAQLEMLTVPKGALRIELSGTFDPTDNLWLNGSHVPVGSLLTVPSLDAATTPLAGALDASLARIFGHAPAGASLGGISSIVSQTHGIGGLGLAVGLSRRVTWFLDVPFVYLRTRSALGYDSTRANVGLNPADRSLGNSAGQAQNTNFFAQFDLAIDSLSKRISSGFYAGDATMLALAQQTLANSPALRSELFTLLSDSAHASLVLPTASSADGTALLGQITQLESTFSDRLGIMGFGDAPALPTAPLGPTAFSQVLGAANGYGLSPLTGLPRWGLGDVTTGVTMQLLQHQSASGRVINAWGQATFRLPNASAADPTVLFDQATGPTQPSITLSGIGEMATHGIGVRGQLQYEHALPSTAVTRVGAPDDLLIPALFATNIREQPGDIMAITARPYVQVAPHLALAGLAEYWRQSASQSKYATATDSLDGIAASVLDMGTAANALVLGVGFSYSHDGRNRDGIVTLPVEAGFSIERTVASSAGIVPAPLTSRVYFRVYESLFKP
ncbi:MAG TPA: hypothetical protein VHW65_01440 [Gemmatimonadales bacterium]|nr:hypothetical protein [Gemmatimonadales bacterium]